MSTHINHIENHQVYFCTLTCYRWLSIFDISKGYGLVYRWFDYLKSKSCAIVGYVIMPNHLHVLLFPTMGSLNKLVANGKRFMAYGIVQSLKGLGQDELLKTLSAGVQPNEKIKGKKHQVFRLSFDARINPPQSLSQRTMRLKKKNDSMSTHTNHIENSSVFFCTLTCYRWLSIFDISKGYGLVYRWFDNLKSKSCAIVGYVIMPNHLHVLLFPTIGSLNKLVANGKRFMAYGIVQNLKELGQDELLKTLSAGVQPNEKIKGKKHQVFRLSFDARMCFDQAMVEQKLDYIHHNPVSGRWNLVEDWASYPHSSAEFYELGKENTYLTHYKEIGLYA